MTDEQNARRTLLKLGAGGLALAATLDVGRAVAQSAPNSLLRKVLDRGRLVVGTGSTNAPWHFEDEKGQLTGMDIAMARILAKALFDDDSKIDFVRQDPAARIPNITTGKVDIVVQFMTISGQRAQLVAFSRPYYIEGAALLVRPDAQMKTFEQLLAAGSKARISVLQNVDADTLVHLVLPDAQVMQVDTQANVIQALESRRVDGATVDLSTVRWMVARNPGQYGDAGKSWSSQLYGAAVKQGDPDWLVFVNTVFSIAMYGHQTQIYDDAFKTFFGLEPPQRKPGFPNI